MRRWSGGKAGLGVSCFRGRTAESGCVGNSGEVAQSWRPTAQHAGTFLGAQPHLDLKTRELRKKHPEVTRRRVLAQTHG